MNVVSSYNDLIDLLKDSFEHKGQGNNNSRVAGLLFAQPNNFTKDEILSGFDYFNNRSGKIIDFFCVGYQPDSYENNLSIVATVDGRNWCFNSKIFEHLRKQTEQRTNWKYSGSVELVLFNSYLDDQSNEVKLDFSDSLSIDLQKAKDDKLITSVRVVFENIFSIAEGISTDNPSKEMSLKLIGNTEKKSFVNILFNLLPKALQVDAKRIYLYGTYDFD